MPKLATVGDTFAVRLRNRSFGAFRIVWARHDWGHTSVVALEWFGKQPPSLAALEQAPVLELTHPGYSGPFWVRILKGRHVPDGYLLIGNVHPSAAELALPLGDDWRDPAQIRRSSVWKAVEHTLYREHRFRNDAKYRATLAAKPQPGDVFAVPLGPIWGVAQLVAISGRIDEDSLAIRHWVTGSSTAYEQAPSLEQARSGLADATRIVSSGDLPPENAVHLGRAPVSVSIPEWVDVLGGWQSVLPRVPKAETDARVSAPPSPAPPRNVPAPLTLASVETVEREDLCAALSELGRSAGMDADALHALIDRERDW